MLSPCRTVLPLLALGFLAVQTGDHGTLAVLLGLMPILAVLVLVSSIDRGTTRLDAAIRWLRRRFRRPARRTPTRPPSTQAEPLAAWRPALAHPSRGPPA